MGLQYMFMLEDFQVAHLMTFVQMGLGLGLRDIVNQGRQEIQGKRRIPNGDKLSLYTPEYCWFSIFREVLHEVVIDF